MGKKQQDNFDFSRFISLSGHQFSFEQAIITIFQYIQERPDSTYRVILGTDSEGFGEVDYATAIVVHRVGAGGRAFVCKNEMDTRSLRQKIYNEATLSLALAQILTPILTEKISEEFARENLVIHIDVGQKGETKDMIREVVGMVHGNGFKVEIKPDSFAASNVADRFTAPPKVNLAHAA
ncbi:MAG: hypothetical protein A2932_01060 [Candidatus Spechtbacteria bacterium RIFCSPLOWO2_01_FULL_46_10]|uniref:DUF458 domain-containing protein n=1 Tax=Candidatus Spechtbacteria bacterium RIFCSPLOWO2_01_FULL_46_10 TaxID=1802163 RepID=A0A1G2HFL9_9BACT|nr:MAG: hypothetical protein A2932_01060 [Candidatus Spechtbacteria bacterium RIFCSPLOWO2_01_FULL_46_10]